MYVNADLKDPSNPIVVAALTHKCQCGAQPGEHCASTLPKPFPDRRLIHYMRVEQWDMEPGRAPVAIPEPETA